MSEDFDWAITGRTRIPRAFPRERGVTHCASLAAVFGDPAVDPRSGGVVGQAAIADVTGYDVRHVRRTLLREDFVRRAGGVAASNVASLEAWEKAQRTHARIAHLEALGMTDVSAGSVLRRMA